MGHLSNMRFHGKGPRGGVSKYLKKPLRKIVSERWVGRVCFETLECGHEQAAVQDLIGKTNATRRRCRKCPDQEKPAPKPYTVEVMHEDEDAWILLFEGDPAKARKEFDSQKYLIGPEGKRSIVRMTNSRGRVLRRFPEA